MNHNLPSSRNEQQGVVLLEALIAVLIFSMGILAIAGLQAAMVKNTSDAKYRADAAFIAQQSLGALWVDPASVVAGTTTTPVPVLPGGTRTITISADRTVSIVVGWQLPGQSAHTFSTSARIAGG